MEYKCKKCGETKSEDFFYSFNRTRCKACKVREAVEYKQRKNPNRRIYKQRKPKQTTTQIENIIEDKEFKGQLLKQLFPTGNIPERFRKRYL